MKIWIAPSPYPETNQGKYIICCDKTKFKHEKKTIIGRLYKATLTDEEMETIKNKIEKVLCCNEH